MWEHQWFPYALSYYNGILLQFRWDSLWWNLQCLCSAGETLEEASCRIQEELESCKLCQILQAPNRLHTCILAQTLIYHTEVFSFQISIHIVPKQPYTETPLVNKWTAAAMTTPYDVKVDEEETFGGTEIQLGMPTSSE